MPYAADRYRYHWGAMLFTAIGYNKPVLVSPELNPEVIDRYKIGVKLDSLDINLIKERMEYLIEMLSLHYDDLMFELQRANYRYSQYKLIQEILKE